jgi:hypothetical protein
MKEDTKTKVIIAPYGAFKEVARLAGCSIPTVRAALRNNASGPKADKARKIFMAKYVDKK